jgi:hypothetical protein
MTNPCHAADGTIVSSQWTAHDVAVAVAVALVTMHHKMPMRSKRKREMKIPSCCSQYK